MNALACECTFCVCTEHLLNQAALKAMEAAPLHCSPRGGMGRVLGVSRSDRRARAVLLNLRFIVFG